MCFAANADGARMQGAEVIGGVPDLAELRDPKVKFRVYGVMDVLDDGDWM